MIDDSPTAYPIWAYRARSTTEECPQCFAAPDHHCHEYLPAVWAPGTFRRQPVLPHLIPVVPKAPP